MLRVKSDVRPTWFINLLSEKGVVKNFLQQSAPLSSPTHDIQEEPHRNPPNDLHLATNNPNQTSHISYYYHYSMVTDSPNIKWELTFLNP